MYCQKCRTPVKLDGSLELLNPAAFELLVSKCAVVTQFAAYPNPTPLQTQRAGPFPNIVLHRPQYDPHIPQKDANSTIGLRNMLRGQFTGDLSRVHDRGPTPIRPPCLEQIVGICPSLCSPNRKSPHRLSRIFHRGRNRRTSKVRSLAKRALPSQARLKGLLACSR